MSEQVIANKEDLLKMIEAIWCEILERDSIEADEDFFEIGGHSLLVVDVLCKIEEQLNIEINQAEFMLEMSTLNECVEYVFRQL